MANISPNSANISEPIQQTHSLAAFGLGETDNGLMRLLGDMTCFEAQKFTRAGQSVEAHDAGQGKPHLAHAQKAPQKAANKDGVKGNARDGSSWRDHAAINDHESDKWPRRLGT